MARYIELDALVAEIKKRGYYAQTMSDNAINGSMRQFYDGMKECCQQLSVFLDTLEVKEVDLKKDSLTWKDINLIDHLLFDIKEDYDNGKLDKEKYYKEVLKKFKAQL